MFNGCLTYVAYVCLFFSFICRLHYYYYLLWIWNKCNDR